MQRLIKYKCDTCNRTISKPENVHGIEFVHGCVLTQNCSGKLFRYSGTDSTSTIVSELEGVTDWTPRKALYTHNQQTPAITWTINHAMGVSPAIQTHVYRSSNGIEYLIEIAPRKIRPISTGITEIDYDRPEYGIAQCITLATSSAPITTSEQQQPYQISVNGVVTFAIASESKGNAVPVDFTPMRVIYEEQKISAGNVWGGTSQIRIGAKTHNVFSIDFFRGKNNNRAAFSNGVIADKTFFKFVNLWSETSTQMLNLQSNNKSLILLGKAPYTKIDKQLTKYIDVADLQDNFVCWLQDGEVWTTKNYVKNTFPPIKP